MSEFEAGLMKTNGANESNPKTKLLGVDNSKGYSGNQNATDGIPKESLSSPNAAELLKRIEEIDDNLHLHKKSIDLATHGEETITLCHGTTCQNTLDTFRYIFSVFLLIMSIISIVYAISEEDSGFKVYTSEQWVLYTLLFSGLFCIGVLEGLQIAVVELAHEDPREYQKYYPRAAKMLKWENTGRNVERFLIGRQVLLVGIVFLVARITTFEVFLIDGVGRWFTDIFLFTGFLGVILTVITAQLTPQVLAAAYPVEFLNLYGMNIAFGACLFVEATGVAHAVWLLCYGIRALFYKCLCKYHALRIMEVNAHKRQGHGHTIDKDLQPHSIDGIDRVYQKGYAQDMANMAKDIEMSVEKDDQSRTKKKRSKSRNKSKSIIHENYSINTSTITYEVDQLMETMGENEDIFYLRGDDKYYGPSYYSDKFKEAGIKPPAFLLPPSDENHIPPHVLCIELLKRAVKNKSQI